MEPIVTGKKRTPKKSAAKVKPIAAKPFEAVADLTVVKKRASGKIVEPDSEKRAVSALPKKAVGKKAQIVAVDPFAEVVMAALPIKKERAKPIKKRTKKVTVDITSEIVATKPEAEISATFEALADVKLPEMTRENRARLQMQTPTRAYFYWSVKENPWALLRNVFGGDLGSYTLVVKLIDKKNDLERVSQCEAEGDWWFDIEPDSQYQAEIGFYAPNRPYFRIVYSNTIETPRRSPSPRAATEADWTVSANKFAEVLDVAGFSRDAVDVAMAGDDQQAAESTSQLAFSKFMGTSEYELGGITAEDIRYAMLALASGVTLDELEQRVSAGLFAILKSNAANIDAPRAMSVLTEYFDVDEAEFAEEQTGSAVFGASRINFPRTLKTKALTPKSAPRYNPVGSHSIRS